MNCFNCGKKIAEDNAEDAKLFADTGMCKECYEKAMVEMHAAVFRLLAEKFPTEVLGLLSEFEEGKK